MKWTGRWISSPRTRRTTRRPRRTGAERLAAAAVLSLLLVCPAFAAEADRPPEEAEQPASYAPAEERSGGLAAAGGTAVLVGAGAYTFVRRKWNEEKEKPREFVHYENHTREGTLTPEERRDLID